MLLQASLGGFRSPAPSCLWAVTAPLGALLFVGLRRATPWFIAFVGGVVVSGVSRLQLSGEGHVPGAVVTFFALNVVGVSTTGTCCCGTSSASASATLGARGRAESERLLLNVLPEPIAQRLKEGPG